MSLIHKIVGASSACATPYTGAHRNGNERLTRDPENPGYSN